jgi:hypothetical protein
MLSKLTVAGLGIAAAALILSPIARADAEDLTNADVAATKAGDAFVPYQVHVPTANGGGGGNGDYHWIVIFDANNKPYTDANGNLLKRCGSKDCGTDYGKVVAKTDCASTGYAVNEMPKKDTPAPDEA